MKLINKLNRIVIIVLLSFIVQGIQAQELTMYNMRNYQGIHKLNPAMNSGCNFYLTLPGFSSIQEGFESRGFPLYDILSKPSDVRNLLGEISSLTHEHNLELLSFGFKLKKSYFSLSVSNKNYLNIGLPKDLILFAWEGNKNFIDKTMDFSNLNFELSNYFEYSFGYSYQLLENLRLGANFKMYHGVGNINTELWDMGIYTNPNTYDLELHSNIILNSSMPFDYVYDSANSDIIVDLPSFEDGIEDYSYFTKNRGFGLDLGGVYELNDRITLSASLIDFISFINWKRGVTNISQDGSYTFSGLDLNPLIYDEDEDIDDIVEQLSDTLSTIFEYTSTNNTYKSSLVPKYYLGGNYKVTNWLDAGLLVSGYYYNQNNYLAYTVSANTYLAKFLSISTNYTLFDSGSSNLGIGIGFRMGPANLYMASDNIFGLSYDNERDILWPGKSQNLDFVIGFNLAFGCKKNKKKDIDPELVPVPMPEPEPIIE